MSAHIRQEGQTCALEVRSQEGETQDGGGGHKSLLPSSALGSCHLLRGRA